MNKAQATFNRSASGQPELADLVRRTLAGFVDLLIPGLMGWGVVAAAQNLDGSMRLVAVVAGIVVLLAWTLAQWWAYGTRKAGVGYRLAGLELVGVDDGQPIGWGRMFLRTLIYRALWASVIGGVLMCIFLVIHDRRQGWHDLAVKSVSIRRMQTVASTPRPKSRHSVGHSSPVPSTTTPLPPHLLPASFDGRGSATSHQQPDWTPPSAPIQHAPGFNARPAPQQAPQPTAAPRQAMEPASNDYGGTNLVPPSGQAKRPMRRAKAWYVQLDDGREIDVQGLVLIGRNPQPRADEQDAQLISAGEGGQTISKTHLALGVDARGVYVVDRGSTNGTALVAGDEMVPCPAGVQMHVKQGQTVSFGDRYLTVLVR